MKKTLKQGIFLFILSLAFFSTRAQTTGTSGSAGVTIPADQPKLVITMADENDYSKTAFDWRLDNVKDAQTAAAIVNGIKTKNASIKTITATPSKIKSYAVHIESNSSLEAAQYFQMFVDENVKYAIINNKAVDLAAFIKKKNRQ